MEIVAVLMVAAEVAVADLATVMLVLALNAKSVIIHGQIYLVPASISAFG